MDAWKITNQLYYNPYMRQMIFNKMGSKESEYSVNTDECDRRQSLHFTPNGYSFNSVGGIFLTNRCPLKCRYCYYETGADGATLTEQQIEVYLKFLVKNALMKKLVHHLTSVSCTLYITGGGEPTSSPDLLKFCINRFRDLCFKSGVTPEISITTNGVCEKETLKFLAMNVDVISISYDGNTIAQNRNRKTKNGENSDDLVRSTIDYLDSIGCKYCIRTTVGDEDCECLKDMYDNIYDNFKNVVLWQLECIFKTGRGTGCNISDYEFANNYLDLLEYSNSKPRKFLISNSAFSESLNGLCPTAKGVGIWLDAYGNLVRCVNKTSSITNYLGTVTDHEIYIAPSGEDQFTNYEENMLKCCKECYAYAHCHGGCPSLMQRDENGKYLSEYSEQICKSIKYYWKTLLTRLYEQKNYAGFELLKNDELSNNDVKVYDIVSKGRDLV